MVQQEWGPADSHTFALCLLHAMLFYWLPWFEISWKIVLVLCAFDVKLSSGSLWELRAYSFIKSWWGFSKQRIFSARIDQGFHEERSMEFLFIFYKNR